MHNLNEGPKIGGYCDEYGSTSSHEILQSPPNMPMAKTISYHLGFVFPCKKIPHINETLEKNKRLGTPESDHTTCVTPAKKSLGEGE